MTANLPGLVEALQQVVLDDSPPASPVEWVGCARQFLAALRGTGWDVVCIECGHVPDTNVEITHQQTVAADNTGETGEVVCLWACGHTVRPGDGPCRIHNDRDPEPF